MDVPFPPFSTTVRSSTNQEATDTADFVDMPQAVEATWLKRDWRLLPLRRGMQLLSRVNPRMATKVFDRIWFTVPRTRPRHEALQWLVNGERACHRVHGQEVVSWAWGAGPTILLLHGWGGHGAQMHAFVAPLIEAGFRVVAFDAPAHGASGPSRLGGRRVTFVEIAAALRVVAAYAGPVVGLVAHSGGCAAAALALRDGWQGPERMAFVAPFALPSAAIEPFARMIGASPVVASMFHENTQNMFARAWSDFDVPALANVREVPRLLVVHDRDDREVPFFNGDAVASAWPGARLHSTSGLGHRRLLRDSAVIAQVVGFMSEGKPATRRTPADARAELDHDYATSGFFATH